MALARADETPRAKHPIQRSARWGDLRTRILSAAILAPVALGCVWIGGTAFAGLIALLVIGTAVEWLRLCKAQLGPRQVLMFASLPLAVFLAAVGQAASALGMLTVVTVVSAIRLGRSAPTRLLPLGIPYIGLAAIALIWLRTAPDFGRTEVVVLLLVIWATDIGAYVVGRAAGGPRLAPRISPGKTWSGAAGGLLAGMLIGYFAAAALGAPDRPWLTALLAGAIGCAGQLGDLFESRLKRHFDVKDTGALIPGHGGLLDRLDALLSAAPVAALLALMLGRGVVPWQ